MEIKKENSTALSRVSKHVFNEKGKGKRNEGIYFSLDDMQDIIDKLREVKSENGVVIDSIAFMIGKKSSKEGRYKKTEYTVEILPFGIKEKKHLFLEVKTKNDETDKEYIVVGAMVPPYDIDGGGGGNQKTPPPSS